MINKDFFGIFCAIMVVLGWAIHDTVIRYAVTSLSANPILFTGLAQVGGAIVLLILAGPGRLASETLRTSHTWTHGLLHILTTTFYSMGLVYVTATEGNFLGRMDILIGFVLAWFFLGRKPSIHDFLGSLPIIVGLVLVTISIPQDIRVIAFTLLLIHSIFATLRAMCGETHPTNNKAENIKERCRVSGIVLLMMGLTFSVLTIVAAFVRESLGAEVAFMNMVPNVDELLNKETIVSGVLMGGITLSFVMYFYFYSLRLIKTEKFLMIGVLLPFFTYGVEWFSSIFGWVDVSQITLVDIFAGILIASGAFYMIYMRQRSDHKAASSLAPEPAE